jgi:hypothetical protein
LFLLSDWRLGIGYWVLGIGDERVLGFGLEIHHELLQPFSGKETTDVGALLHCALTNGVIHLGEHCCNPNPQSPVPSPN